MRVLLLGGTGEARELAARLHPRIDIVSSLAGRVPDPALPVGSVRIGGFGGVDGLRQWLQDNGIDAVVDATHPFAATMTAHAAAACAVTGVALLRLERPSWAARPDAEHWHWVGSLDEARGEAERLGERVFLAIGRQELGVFAGWTDRYVLARMVDAPGFAPPATWEVVRARGPFRLPDELELLTSRAIDVLVTKDSGGGTDAKLDAAATLGVPVVAVRRPPPPEGIGVVSSVDEAVAWIVHRPGAATP